MKDFAEICEYIEKNIEKAIELEKLLTKIPALAPENSGDGESKKCKALEEFLCANGITDFQHFDAPDIRVTSGVRPNLVATINGKTSKTFDNVSP